MQPLADVKVLDLSWHVAGPYATKLLSDYGADVIKVERPGSGDPARTYGPFPGDEPHPERSGAFLHLNTNKRSVTVNLRDEAGKQIVQELARWADVLVESFAPGTLAALGLDYAALRKLNPSLVMCSISNFGQTGPWRDWKANEFTLAALAGLTYMVGVPEREPLKSVDHLQEYQAGAMGAMAIMGAVRHQRLAGVGQHIDIAVYEVAADSADRRTTHLTGYAYTGLVPGREGGHAGLLPIGAYPTVDGYAHIVASPAARWPRFMRMVGRPDLVEDPRLQSYEFWAKPEAKELVDSLLYSWMLDRTKQQVMVEGQAARVPVTALNTTLEALRDPHFRARGYWTWATHPEAGTLPHVGPSFRKEGEGWLLRRTAPLLGEHNREVLSGLLGLSPAEMVLLRETGAI